MAGMFATGTVIIGRVGDDPLPGYLDVRVDRKTIFGNPNPKGVNGTRKEVCEMYKHYAVKRMAKRGKYFRRIESLRAQYRAGQKIRLLCHCFPKQCHGLTVKDLIEGRL